ncbi:DUF805 domain-containing protein [Bifidobacterium leontopitheci]|uniref:DUF805 domain-containing protein n=1 Tax=Bifidobacterium leontopitheci TaxID=2650774 RepID=A0A6I1GHL4_9BIFI|nr:DUF805 domain-containing protein [Bifidobacterium leontopitheci]KAB7790202.1 hypothetical protein F7D09_1274 [Bifidobacterium leontopitheci]
MTDSNPFPTNPGQDSGVPTAPSPTAPSPATPEPAQQSYGQSAYETPQPQYAQPAYGQPSQPQYSAPAYGQYQQQPAPAPQYAQTPFGNTPSAAGSPEPPLDQPWYGATFVGAIQRGFKKLFVFTGRASRSEYWWWWLFMALVSVVLVVLANIAPVFALLLLVWGIATLVLNYGITVRRGHDSNKSTIVASIPYGILVLGNLIYYILLFLMVSKMSSGSYTDAASLLLNMDSYKAMAVIGELMIVGGGIANLVFMLLGTNPAGEQYDHLPAFGAGANPTASAAQFGSSTFSATPAAPAQQPVPTPAAQFPAAPAASDENDEDGATVLGSYHSNASATAPAAPSAWQPTAPAPAPAYGQNIPVAPAAGVPAPGTVPVAPAGTQPAAAPTFPNGGVPAAPAAGQATAGQTAAASDDDMDATVLGSYHPQQ